MVDFPLLKQALIKFATKTRARQMLRMPSLRDSLFYIHQYLRYPETHVKADESVDFHLNKRKPNVESMGIHVKKSMSSRSSSFNDPDND